MEPVADGVLRLAVLPRDLVNVYLVEDVLVDAGTPWSRKAILAALAGREVRRHVVTHAHSDHFGSSHAVCEQLGIPLEAGAVDADAIEAGEPAVPQAGVGGVLGRLIRPAGHPVARRLREGDEVAGFAVLDTPGHSPGHVSLWRERDRTLVAADAAFGVNVLTTAPGLHEPPRAVSVDPERNRESIRRLAELEPALVLFGHGPPLRDPVAFRRFADSLR